MKKCVCKERIMIIGLFSGRMLMFRVSFLTSEAIFHDLNSPATMALLPTFI